MTFLRLAAGAAGQWSLLATSPAIRSRARPLLLCARALSVGSLPDHKALSMPKLSPTMEVGTIQEWKKAAGEKIEAGDILAEIETDKATRSFEYNDDGYMAKVFIEEGTSDVPVGKLLCIVVEEERDIAAFKDYVPPEGNAAPIPAPVDVPAPAAAPTSPTPANRASAPGPVDRSPSRSAPAAGQRILASPLARRAAADAGLSLASVIGSGPGGRVVAADVAEAAASGMARAAGPGVAVSNQFADVGSPEAKRASAERLSSWKQSVPHYYVATECCMDRVLEMCLALNAKAGAKGPHISPDEFVLKAAAAALRRVPDVNAQWMGDTVRMFQSANICVALESPNGMVTPVVRNADRKGVRDISDDVKELTTKTSEGSLTPEDLEGGTFTVTNLGTYGVTEVSAIINEPQAAILTVGTATKRVVPDSSSTTGFGTSTVMSVTLTCDHRVVDGAVGARWLAAFKACVEDPVEMIL